MNARSLSHNFLLILVAITIFGFAKWSIGASDPPKELQQENPLFRSAMEDWNNRRWEESVAKFRQFVEQFPNDPLAADAHFQIGYYLSYTATPDEAIAEYEKVIAMSPGTHDAHESKIGIAALKFFLQDYDAAYELFRQVIRETKDWSLVKECTFRMKEIGRLIALRKLPSQRIAMSDCGPKALALIFKQQRINTSDEEMRTLVKVEQGGATMEQLKEASLRKGLKSWGVKLKGDQLGAVPKPFIAFIRPNHYVVVTKAGKERIEITDPHRGDTYRTNDRFQRLWQGYALIFAKQLPSQFRSQVLSNAEMERIRGGHHLHGMNLGGANGNPDTQFKDDASQCPTPGLPRWSVNLANYNLLVTDTDFAYSGRGSGVALTRIYNADDPRESVFGRSWTFNYDVYLAVNANGSVDVKREDGKVDNFVARGDGTFDPPLWVHDRLIQNTDGTYRLDLKRTRITESFNAQGKLAQITDRNNNSVTLQYDANNRLVSVTDAAGRLTHFNYNAGGKVSEVVDPINRSATFTYDANNNLISTVDMAGNVSSFAYDSNSYMTSLTTPNGTTQIRNGSTLHFTEFPNVVKDIIDPAGNTTHFDTGDYIAWVIDARGNQTFYFNNGDGATTQIEDPLGNKTTFEFYNFSQDLTAFWDANGHHTSLSNDARGNVLWITDPVGNTTFFAYDSRDNLTQITDPLNRIYRYEYDAKDNLTKVTDPINGMTTFTYDSFGQMITLTEARSNTTTFIYDSTGNLTGATNPVGGTITSSYDGVGRLLSQTDPKNQTFGYTYDGIDRLTQITQPGGATTNYMYSCCTLASITDPSGTLSFAYDAVNRLTQFTNNRNQIIGYAYDANGNLTALTYPDGKVVHYDHDTANRLKKVTDWLDNTTDYNYDAAGNLISSFNSNGTMSGYQYDAANRLASLTNARSNGSVISAYRYTKDILGNRTGFTAVEPVSPILPSRNISSTYDADNRIQTAGGVTYTHDNNGNLLAASGTTSASYTYDVFNRLTQATTPGQTAQYQYDGLGNRITRTVNGSATKYIVDPSGSLSRVLAETDNAGNITSYYVYGLGLISKITPPGQSYFYHYDGAGNTAAITDPSGALLNKYAYDPAGNVSSNSSETVANSFRYAGGLGVMDEGNGLLYMRARYYAPGAQRFINKDPVGFLGGLNPYSYAANNSVNWIDPAGLWYLDLNFTGGVGLAGTFGLQIGPGGIFAYGGTGYGTGGGGSLTLNSGDPSQGLALTATVGAHYLIGGTASVSYTEEGASPALGAGVGIELGWAVTATSTYKLWGPSARSTGGGVSRSNGCVRAR